MANFCPETIHMAYMNMKLSLNSQQQNTNAVTWSSAEGNVSIWMSTLNIFWEEAFRFETLWIWEVLGISVE